MKTDKISEAGLVGNDGRMRLPMDRINAFCVQHKGERLIVHIEAAAPGSSKLQQAYYYNYVVPAVSASLYEQGTRMSEERVDKWLIEQYPGDFQYDGNRLTIGRQLSKSQMSDFLEWLKQYAAENLNIYIEDPKTL
jgi:hypothetical protein